MNRPIGLWAWSSMEMLREAMKTRSSYGVNMLEIMSEYVTEKT